MNIVRHIKATKGFVSAHFIPELNESMKKQQSAQSSESTEFHNEAKWKYYNENKQRVANHISIRQSAFLFAL